MNIPKHVIDKKIQQNIKKFNVNGLPRIKFITITSFKFLKKLEKYIFGKFQCISLINFSFDDVLFFNFYFNTTLMYFLSPHFFIFSM
jgi:hypothetical protein